MVVQEVSFVVLLFASTVVILVAETLFAYLQQKDKMLSANILEKFMETDVDPLHVDARLKGVADGADAVRSQAVVGHVDGL